MQPIVTNRVVWSVYLSVCRSVTLVSPAKIAEPIEMLFGFRTLVGPGNNVLDGGPDLPIGNQFSWLLTGYNFGCMVASDTLFDFRGGFSGSSYPMKT